MKKFYLLGLIFLITIMYGCSNNYNIPDNHTQKTESTIQNSSSYSSIINTEETKINSLKITNKTGFDLYEIEISEYKKFDWSVSFYAKNKFIINNSTNTINIDVLDKNNLYDIKAITLDEKEYVWERLKLSSVSELTLFIEDFIPNATFR